MPETGTEPNPGEVVVNIARSASQSFGISVTLSLTTNQNQQYVVEPSTITTSVNIGDRARDVAFVFTVTQTVSEDSRLIAEPMPVFDMTLPPVADDEIKVTPENIPAPNDSDGVDYRSDVEFMANPALAVINADAAYQRGYWGQGVTVAVVDAWLSITADFVGEEFGNRLVPSIPNAIVTQYKHDGSGRIESIRQAAIIGAARNGSGIQGVAPSVHILPVFEEGFYGYPVVEPLWDYEVVYHPLCNCYLDTFDVLAYPHDILLSAVTKNAPIINIFFQHHIYGNQVYGENTYDADAGVIRNHSLHNRITNHYLSQGIPSSWLDNWHEGILAPFHPYEALQWRLDIHAIATVSKDRDFVAVWDAGNGGWHTGGRVALYGYSPEEDYYTTPEYILQSLYYSIQIRDYDYPTAVAAQTYNMTISITSGLISITTGIIGDRHRQQDYVFTITGGIARRIDGDVHIPFTAGRNLTFTALGKPVTISAYQINEPSHWGLAPRYAPELLGKWIVAVAVDNQGTIAHFSNGCGLAKYWCLAAPGVSILAYDHNGSLTARSGTGHAAAHISGALALLKSRFPDMPMSVIAAILMNTAEDLGTVGVDEIYGHGMINISAAINTQDSAHLVFPNGEDEAGGNNTGNAVNAASTAPPPLLALGKVRLPHAFADIGGQIGGVHSAVRYLDDRYYDAPVNVDIAAAPKLSPMRAVDNLWDDDYGGDNNGDIDNANFFVRRQGNGALRAAGGNYHQLQLRHHWFGDAPVWN
ncbi:MAG: S8 family serine peptidase, partial [Gammaproteobacteria bacterium]